MRDDLSAPKGKQKQTTLVSENPGTQRRIWTDMPSRASGPAHFIPLGHSLFLPPYFSQVSLFPQVFTSKGSCVPLNLYETTSIHFSLVRLYFCYRYFKQSPGSKRGHKIFPPTSAPYKRDVTCQSLTLNMKCHWEATMVQYEVNELWCTFYWLGKCQSNKVIMVAQAARGGSGAGEEGMTRTYPSMNLAIVTLSLEWHTKVAAWPSLSLELSDNFPSAS